MSNMKHAQRVRLADKLHRGFVWGCIGLTVVTGLAMALKGYEYVLYVRPERKAFEAKLEQELLMEGTGFKSSPNEELKA